MPYSQVRQLYLAKEINNLSWIKLLLINPEKIDKDHLSQAIKNAGEVELIPRFFVYELTSF